ncbi:unnamed protein product [Rotaria sp. Silwood1]|nr:unnamed protein product [Rotaria sp. Silwood1]
MGWSSLFIFFIGTFGNILDIILLIRLENLNTLASSLFLLASFIGSQCLMLTATLLRVIFGLTGYDPLFASLFLCKARWMIGPASGAFSLTCVSLAGFFSIYAVFFVAPTPDSCRLVNPIMVQLMPFIGLFVYSVIPIIALSILCRLIWHTLRQLPVTYLHGGNRSHDQVTCMIIAQMIVVIITSFPSAVYSVYTISTRTIIKSSWRLAVETLANTHKYFSLGTVAVLIDFLKHAIMFYVYLIASKGFYQNVKTMFHAGFQRIARLCPQLFVNAQVIIPLV